MKLKDLLNTASCSTLAQQIANSATHLCYLLENSTNITAIDMAYKMHGDAEKISIMLLKETLQEIEKFKENNK